MLILGHLSFQGSALVARAEVATEVFRTVRWGPRWNCHSYCPAGAVAKVVLTMQFFEPSSNNSAGMY